MQAIIAGLFVAILVQGLHTFARQHHRNQQETTFIVSTDDFTDFVTSRERCLQNGGSLARFMSSVDNTVTIDRSIKLQRGTTYWIEVDNDINHTYFDPTHCIGLSVLGKSNKARYLIANCANKYRYICTLLTPTVPCVSSTCGLVTDQSRFEESTVSDAVLLISSYITDIVVSHISSEVSSTSGVLSTTFVHFYTFSSMTSSNVVIMPTSSVDNMIHDSSIQIVPTKTVASMSTLCEAFPEMTSSIDQWNHVPKTCFRRNDNNLCGIYCGFNEPPRINVTEFQNIPNTTNLNLFPELEINAKQTSKALRKKTSANDPRPSTRAMGVAASFVITAVVFFIVIIDIPRIMSQFQSGKCKKKQRISEC